MSDDVQTVWEALGAAVAFDSKAEAAVARLVAALSAATTERDEARKALTLIAESRRPCVTCGKEHVQGPPRDGYSGSWADPDDGHVYKQMDVRTFARSAAAAPAATLNEPERWPCGCVKGETPHGAGWADCEFAATGAAPNETEQGE